MPSNFLEDYVGVAPFAAELKKHPRTIVRWMNAENGLPFVQLGNRKLVHLPTAREWLLNKIRRPNPARQRRRMEPAA
jgi:hypothetical protein